MKRDPLMGNMSNPWEMGNGDCQHFAMKALTLFKHYAVSYLIQYKGCW